MNSQLKNIITVFKEADSAQTTFWEGGDRAKRSLNQILSYAMLNIQV